MATREKNTPVNITKFWFYLTICLVVIAVIYFLGSVLTPFVAAALLAYLTDPIVEFLQKFKIPRIVSAILVFVLIITVLLTAVLILIPVVEKQIVVVIDKMPDIINWLTERLSPWLKDMGISFSLTHFDAKNALTQHWQQAGTVATQVIKTVSTSGWAIITTAANLLIIPIVLFYLLRDWPNLLKGFQSLLPRGSERTIVVLLKECDAALSGFLRGQLLVMISLAIIYTIGLAIVGLDTALFIGVLSGIVSIVPYLGFIVGIALASIASLWQFHDLWHFAGVILVFLIAQGLEGTVLTPYLVGDRIGLHPVVVIFSVLAGGELFGFIGVLLALPLSAVLMVFLRYLRKRYVASTLYD